jgi:CheY-like chemotaxis protein
MVGKRALVVDDSKSSRAFLAKLLEEQQVAVDAAESAEQAIDYLAGHQPDVIFMDHLMPGMDGFQAVQAIKNNPQTAAIPILMYTSQQGELYLGQARALGAAGVLAKGAQTSELRALLEELNLAPPPESAIVVTPPPVELQAAAAILPVTMPAPAPGPNVAALLEGAVLALRQHVSAELESQARALGELPQRVVAALPPPPVVEAPPAPEPEKPRHSPVSWLLALAASVAAAVLGTLLWQADGRLATISAELKDSKATVTLLTARLAPPAPEPAVVAESPPDGTELAAQAVVASTPAATPPPDAAPVE